MSLLKGIEPGQASPMMVAEAGGGNDDEDTCRSGTLMLSTGARAGLFDAAALTPVAALEQV